VFSIFIAYRQSDSKAWAIGLRDALAAAFGEDAVFLDKDGLGAGLWSAQIHDAIAQCRVLLVVIGRGWLAACDNDDKRRLWLPEDMHRRELEFALSLPDLAIVPVRVDAAFMPAAHELPPALSRLASHQSFEIGDTLQRRRVDIARIVCEIEKRAGLVARRQPHETPTPRLNWRALLLAAALLTMLLAVGFSMSSMSLDNRELVLVFTASLALLYCVTVLWRWVFRLGRHG
jgi:TIR domain